MASALIERAIFGGVSVNFCAAYGENPSSPRHPRSVRAFYVRDGFRRFLRLPLAARDAVARLRRALALIDINGFASSRASPDRMSDNLLFVLSLVWLAVVIGAALFVIFA
jgi:hypothetical protein